MKKAKVYFTKTITPENVIRMYEALGPGAARQGGRKGPFR